MRAWPAAAGVAAAGALIAAAAAATKVIIGMLAARARRRYDREVTAARRADQAAWRDFGRGRRDHDYVRWDHCDQCWAAFDRAGNRGGLR